MTRTYYEIFGVKRTATSDEIRAAYLALVKRHHPDVADAGAAASGPDMIALLNRCYAVLKDPRQRAAYDVQLAQQSGPRQALVSTRGELIPQPGTAPQRRRGMALAIAATVTVAILALLAQGSWASPGDVASLFPWGGDQPDQRPDRPLNPSEVAHQAELATTVSTDLAIGLSKDCFDAARARGDLTSVKLCIIFDDAFLYWRQNANDYDSMPLYFHDEITRMRHLDAIGEPDEDAEKTLAQLRDVTFKALLSQLTHSPEPTPSTAGHRAEIGKLSTGARAAQSQNETAISKKIPMPVHI